jgi:hypothetical protein
MGLYGYAEYLPEIERGSLSGAGMLKFLEYLSYTTEESKMIYSLRITEIGELS